MHTEDDIFKKPVKPIDRLPRNEISSSIANAKHAQGTRGVLEWLSKQDLEYKVDHQWLLEALEANGFKALPLVWFTSDAGTYKVIDESNGGKPFAHGEDAGKAAIGFLMTSIEDRQWLGMSARSQPRITKVLKEWPLTNEWQPANRISEASPEPYRLGPIERQTAFLGTK